MKFQELYSRLIDANPKSTSFEKRLIQSTSLMLTALSFFAAIINYKLGFSFSLIWFPLFTSIIFFLFFLVGRVAEYISILKYIISFFAIFSINYFWYHNYGSHGPAPYFFTLILIFIIFLWSKWNLVFFSSIIGINILVLFYLDYNYRSLTNDYDSYFSRIADVYIGIFLYSVLIFIFILNTKKYYLKQNKKAQLSDELKSAFLANVSHDIRTPMNTILGFSNMLTDEDLSDTERKNYSEIITEKGDVLMRLIDNILEVSKLESNQLTLVYEPFDPCASMEEIYKTYKSVLRRKRNSNVKLLLSKPEKTPPVITDKVRVEQIIRNLLDNAFKFTNEGEIEFACDVMNDRLAFSVRDSGIGIKPGLHDHIFTRFSNFNENKENVYSGTGIGLFLSKNLVNLLGGDIWFKSEYGTGTTFFFTIPFMPSHLAKGTASSSAKS